MLLDADLTASEIEVLLLFKACCCCCLNYNGKLVSYYRLIQKFFATLIRNTDCKYFFNSGTFILTNLASISLSEIVLKL